MLIMILDIIMSRMNAGLTRPGMPRASHHRPSLTHSLIITSQPFIHENRGHHSGFQGNNSIFLAQYIVKVIKTKILNILNLIKHLMQSQVPIIQELGIYWILVSARPIESLEFGEFGD